MMKILFWLLLACSSIPFYAFTPKSSASSKAALLQGEPLPGTSVPAAYNVQGSINVASQRMGWVTDVFTTAAFTYWYANEEGLWLAQNANINTGGQVLLPLNTFRYDLPYKYNPGFKITAGVVGDHEWTLSAGYIYFRAHNKTSRTAPTNPTISGVGVWYTSDWFLQASTMQGTTLTGTHISGSWKCNLDMWDLTVSRPFYEGRNLIVSPTVGLRATWLRQSMLVGLTQDPYSEGGADNLPPQPIFSHNHVQSWGLGPRGAVDLQYLIPFGFRFQGDFGISLLYERYTTIKHSENAQSINVAAGPYTAEITGFNALEPILETSLGFGWGQYCFDHKYHVDFSASYELLLFWSGQNMMRRMMDQFLAGVGAGNLNLHMHGMTLTGRFDF